MSCPIDSSVNFPSNLKTEAIPENTWCPEDGVTIAVVIPPVLLCGIRADDGL